MQMIDIDAPVSPAVLASILGINVSMIYQGRQDGKLPPNTDANYRQCISHYCNYWKTKSGSKVSSVAEAAMLQKMKLDAAKTEDQWLSIKQKRGELIEVNTLAETFEPVFLHLRTQLVSIGRKHPEVEPLIDKALDELFHVGESVLAGAKRDLDAFIETKMEASAEIPSLEEEDAPLNSFSDYVPPVGDTLL